MENFLCADCDSAVSVAKIHNLISYIHVKDFIVKPANDPNPGKGFFKSRGENYLRGTIIGHGSVPLKQCFSILQDSGYDNWLSVEFEGMEDTMEALEINLEFILWALYKVVLNYLNPCKTLIHQGF